MCDLLGRRGRAGGRPPCALYTGSLPACCYASAVYMYGRESEAQLKSILTQNISRTPSRPGIINAAVHCSSRSAGTSKPTSPRRTTRFYAHPPDALHQHLARFPPSSPPPGRTLALSNRKRAQRLSGKTIILFILFIIFYFFKKIMK